MQIKNSAEQNLTSSSKRICTKLNNFHQVNYKPGFRLSGISCWSEIRRDTGFIVDHDTNYSQLSRSLVSQLLNTIRYLLGIRNCHRNNCWRSCTESCSRAQVLMSCWRWVLLACSDWNLGATLCDVVLTWPQGANRTCCWVRVEGSSQTTSSSPWQLFTFAITFTTFYNCLNKYITARIFENKFLDK